MDVMDEGTKAAVAEQLRLGEELRRKVSLTQLSLLLLSVIRRHKTVQAVALTPKGG